MPSFLVWELAESSGAFPAAIEKGLVLGGRTRGGTMVLACLVCLLIVSIVGAGADFSMSMSVVVVCICADFVRCRG